MKDKTFKAVIELWKQFIPLSLTDMAMAFGEPVRNYTIATLPNGEVNLASFGIAKSLANFFEAPIIMILHASNALAKDKESSIKFLRFTLVFSFLLAILFLGTSIPFIFEFIGEYIFNLDTEISETTRKIIYFIFLFPFIIGWRRYFQGILIHQKKNHIVAQASLVRLFFVITFPLIGIYLSWSGLACAISSLIGGLFAESIYITFYSLSKKNINLTKDKGDNSSPKSYLEISKYYFPLAYSMVVIWGTRALLFFMLSYAIDAKKSLVLWPIIWGFVVIVSNGTRMVQQVYIASKDDLQKNVLNIFTLSVAFIFTLFFLFFIVTPWGNNIISLSMGNLVEYNNLVLDSLVYFLLFPTLTTFQNILQGELILKNKTKAIGLTAIPSHIILALIAYALIKINVSGITSLAIALNLGLIIEIVFLKIIIIKFRF